MLTTIKAKFTDGVIVPLEPLDLAEGDMVFVTVDVKKAGKKAEPPKTPASPDGIRKAIADANEMKRTIYESRRDIYPRRELES